MAAIKSEGNEHFKKKEYKMAITFYENALNLCKDNNEMKEDQGTILKNKAACYLRMVCIAVLLSINTCILVIK